MLQEIGGDIQELLSQSTFENLQIFSNNAEGFGSKEKVLRGGTSKDFEEKWDGNLRDMESKCRDLFLEEHCKKVFYLMDCFWEAIVDVDVDIGWLVNVRNNLNKIENEHGKTKRKKLASLSRNSHLKRMVLEQLEEYFPHFQFKSKFFSYCNSLCPEFENLYTLVTINRTSKYPKEESASSQTCQGGEK